MLIKTLTVDGIEHLVILERSSNDGGVVVAYLSPDKDGAMLAKRDWYSDPDLARKVYDAVDAPAFQSKRMEALDITAKPLDAAIEAIAE